MTYQEEEQSGGKKMRMKKVARPARKPMRAVMAKPKKAPARKRVFHSKLLKHFGGFFSELEGFAEQMSKVEHSTPAAKKANFTNGMPTPMPKPPASAAHMSAQDGGRRPRRKVAPKKKVVRRSRSLFGGADEEEFGVYGDMVNTTGAIADSTVGRIAEAASSVSSGLPSVTSGGARHRVRRVRRASPARSASPVRRRRVVRRASPRY
jgi:hypothetical protein